MRNKKLLSTVVASALVATTMAMPVMAAESGHVDVDLTTKTAVIRVKVPTSMNVAVNQFEISDNGSQIYSDDFEMENKSEIPVKVNVTSTATIKAGNNLVAKKSDAEAATANAGDAWLAAAAQIAAGQYAETGKTLNDLTEASKNVATIVKDEDNANTAKQTFYLNQSSGAAYKMLTGVTDASSISYAECYKLIDKTGDITGTDDAAKQKALDELIAGNDVYVGTAAAANEQVLTKIAKGTTTQHAFSASEFYYIAETDKATTFAAGDKYLYADGGVSSDGKAVFRYIGKLAEAQDTWTKEDISKIVVSYEIVGVKKSQYDDLASTAGTLTYGLYKKSDPVIAYVSGKDDSDVVLKIKMPTGKTLATNYTEINGVNISTWQTYSSKVTFNSTDNTVKIAASAFAFSTITEATTDHKYTFTFKDTDGTEYESEEIDLTP